MPVSVSHPEYASMLSTITMVRDAVKGDPAIKAKKETYLPADFARNDDGEYSLHYSGFLTRAYFLGVTGRTKESMIGMVFRKEPEIKAPSNIEAFFENIDGAGQSLLQIAKESVAEALEAGKHYLLVDYPKTEEGLDSEAEKKLGLRPVILPYSFESLINWRFENTTSGKRLVLAVLREVIEDNIDEFAHNQEFIYRVLRLTDGVYTQQVYDNSGKEKGEEYAPRMAGGSTFDHIPFHIAGAKNNLAGIDMPPLYDIARVNISHYQTTANVKESGYIGTQPLLHIDVGETDLTEWKTHNPDSVTLGNRNGLITRGGKLEIVQAEATDYNMTVMDREEAQMVALGAQMIVRGRQAETAEAARIDASAEASVLEVVVGNVSEMIEAALEDFALFLGTATQEVLFSLSKDFWEASLDSQSLQAVVQARQLGSISSKDVLYMIRQGAIRLNPERTDDEILADAGAEILDDLSDIE